ncbi:hypothetical protein A0O28_0026830 [Trichoderma guizhouense]|uniref:Uncharacterized protein n=1 Tax=Trichoderma guizhouense TaxID=1491466 RepID=A0A1T3CTP7_9HYPO|nr:hypothetical protein A0O28_0026830 [Trichoderma guizhouense]
MLALRNPNKSFNESLDEIVEVFHDELIETATREIIDDFISKLGRKVEPMMGYVMLLAANNPSKDVKEIVREVINDFLDKTLNEEADNEVIKEAVTHGLEAILSVTTALVDLYESLKAVSEALKAISDSS